MAGSQQKTDNERIELPSTRGGDLFFSPLVDEVTGPEKGEAGEHCKYRVTKYRYKFNLGKKTENNVKWAIKIDGNKEELGNTGEEIELEILNEWVGREIIVMPYLVSPTERVSVKTWCYILKHDILRKDAILNKIAINEKPEHDDYPLQTICKAFNELSKPMNVGRFTTIRDLITVQIKLFQNEYMNKYTADKEYEENCSGKIDSETILAMDKALINGWKLRWYELGSYYNGIKMIVRAYGEGSNKAIFLIGGIHSDELGGRRAIKIMKNCIKENPSYVPSDTTVFVLNPASISNDRNINGIDPNRAFFLPDTAIDKPKEVKAISTFLLTIAQQFSHITIISGHTGNDLEEGRFPGEGVVFPLYKLTASGEIKVKNELKGRTYYVQGIKLINNDNIKYYNNPQTSVELMDLFWNCTKFRRKGLWDDSVYYGELIYFIADKINKPVTMIEFETPLSLTRTNSDKIESMWGNAFREFIEKLLKRI
ncbi:MAG: hypothetical protein LBV17_03350 [Treponema sp.]|jgi:hypothetical protein|nr:hypothetical protein [Treponema sp.]